MHEQGNRPRALFLHQGGGAGGVYGSDRVFRQVIEALVEDIEPIIILDGDGLLAEQLRDLDAEVIIRRLGVLRRKLLNPLGLVQAAIGIAKATWWLRAFLRREAPVFVYTNTLAVLSGVLSARLCGIRHIWHIHEIVERPRSFAWSAYRLVTGPGTEVIANSEATAKHIKKESGNREGRIAVVHNGVPIGVFDAARGEALRRELGIGPDTVLVGFVGRVHYLKGLEYLLETVGRAARGGAVGFQVVIAGDVYPGYEPLLRKLRRITAELGLADRVHFVGHREDVPDIHKALDVLVVPSTLPESFGLTAVEAMAASKPVVATDHGALPEIVEDGVTGYLIPLDDPDAFADRLIRLTGDESLRIRMGAKGRERIEARFTIERFASGIRGVVLGNRL